MRAPAGGEDSGVGPWMKGLGCGRELRAGAEGFKCRRGFRLGQEFGVQDGVLGAGSGQRLPQAAPRKQ